MAWMNCQRITKVAVDLEIVWSSLPSHSSSNELRLLVDLVEDFVSRINPCQEISF